MLHKKITEKESCTIFAPRAVHYNPMPLRHLCLHESIGLWQGTQADVVITGLWRRIGRQWHAGVCDARRDKILWMAQEPVVHRQDRSNTPLA